MPLTLPQSENCLTLNIFVPGNQQNCWNIHFIRKYLLFFSQNLANISSNEKLAVLMFIHGGGYVEGSSDEFFYGHDFLIEKQIILVTMNYRLGMFGFLSLGLPEYSGNMGLKDQQMALKWLNENIDSFGGDNKRITILGHSAGKLKLSLKCKDWRKTNILILSNPLFFRIKRKCCNTFPNSIIRIQKIFP